LAVLPQIAMSNQSVLITGDTGVGKEMVSHAVHGLSPLASGPFVALNCGAIPESLIEGELFGHEKGAFTGAHSARKGKFELAQNGTLFLDEIGTMSLELQVRLLRVLEDRVITRVGGEKPIPVSVRIIAATRTRLEDAVENGLFREDLYYRLNILRIQIPSLKERTDDIPMLAKHFLERSFTEVGIEAPYPTLTKESLHLLKQQPWKGNVRELRNVMTRCAVLLQSGVQRILPSDLMPYLSERGQIKREEASSTSSINPQQLASPEKTSPVIMIPVGTSMEEATNQLISETLAHTNYNRTKTAKILGIGVRTLRRKLNEN